jgi:hypothetical protein
MNESTPIDVVDTIDVVVCCFTRYLEHKSEEAEGCAIWRAFSHP